MSSENAVLEFTISINVKASAETEDTLQRLENAKRLNSDVRETNQNQNINNEDEIALKELEDTTNETNNEDKIQLKRLEEGKQTNIEETTKKFFEEKKQEEEKPEKSKISDITKEIDSKGISTLKNIATNPAGSIIGYLTEGLSALVPEAADLIPVIGLIIASPEVAKLVIETLSAKGGPLNRDFLNAVNKQVNAGLTLQQVKQKLEGIDLVTIAQQSGFTPNNSNWTYNSFFAINAQRAERIGLSYRAAGFYEN